MSNFKAGDLIKCIRQATVLTLDRIYRAEVVADHTVSVRDDSGGISTWYNDRFEVINYQYTISGVDNIIIEDVAKHGAVVEVKRIPKVNTTLPTDSNERKNYPLFRGALRYFPAALAGISKISKLGNDKHNLGQELHHDRNKSMDHGDCILRHLMDAADLLAALDRNDSKVTQQDVLNEASQLAWRALAFSQELHERFGAPLAPGAKK